MEGSAAAEPSPAPPWEKRYPGRLNYELDRLKEAGANPVVDDALLAQGIFALDLIWKVDGKEVPLRAVYPDGFPRLRPNVKLSGSPDTFPDRHCNPAHGDLCLLGRDTAQWLPSWTLAKLLESQLHDALNGTGEEDPQGEPAEVWWNSFGLDDSYCLVDSSWNLGDAREGTITVRYVGKSGRAPEVQAAITEVRDAGREVLAVWDEALPEAVRKGHGIAVPWVRVDGSFLPRDASRQILDLLNEHDRFKKLAPRELLSGFHGYFFCVVYDLELSVDTVGTGWLLGVVHGSRKAFGGKGGQQLEFRTLPTLRAGKSDIGSRVPAVAALQGRKVALFGAGAIGSPLALELARNGCSEIRLLDHDKVEPGNSIRWPIGASAWGKRKTEALADLVKANFPWSNVRSFVYGIGREVDGRGDDAVLREMLEGVDLAIDATAAFGVTTLIHDYTAELGLPLISLWATPSVEGGVVALYVPGSGCPVCVEHYHADGSIEPPPGLASEESLVQPPGCAERTFTGGSFDLQELSFEAFRVTLGAITFPPVSSVLETLSLMEDSRRIPPRWRIDDLPPHKDCHCRQ